MLLLMLYVQETQPVQKLFILMVFNKRYVPNPVFFVFFGLAKEKWAMFSG